MVENNRWISVVAPTWNRPLRNWGGFKAGVSSSFSAWLLERPSDKDIGMKTKREDKDPKTETQKQRYEEHMNDDIDT